MLAAYKLQLRKGAAIKTIPYRFALGSSKLAKAYIPASVTLIDTFAFSTCSGIKEVEFEYGGTEDLVINGSAFYGNTGLLSLALPSRLVSIGNSAFYNSGSLASITFADPVEEGKEAVPSKLQTIGLSAFYGSALVEVYLPGSLGNATFTSGTAQKLAVDGYSFRNSKSLKRLYSKRAKAQVTDLHWDSMYSKIVPLSKKLCSRPDFRMQKTRAAA